MFLKGALIFIFFVSGFWFYPNSFMNRNGENKIGNMPIANISLTSTPAVIIKNISIPVEVVNTPLAMERGLSGRKSLAQDEGMLFIFSKSDYHTFWMPDMNFSLDMLWLDDNFKIVDMVFDASPLTNKNRPVFYAPSKPARYTLEVNSGFAKKNNFAKGDKVVFKNIFLK